MIYVCIHVDVLCLFCCLGLLDSFGPLWTYTWVYVSWVDEVCMFWELEGKEEMVCRWSWVLDELRFGSRRFIRPPNLLHGDLVATACPRVFLHVRLCLGDSAAEGAAEGAWVSSLERTFGRRTCRLKCPVQLSFACFAWIVSEFKGILGEFKRGIHKLVWSLIWVHLYRYRPEEPERAAVSSAPEFTKPAESVSPDSQRWVELTLTLYFAQWNVLAYLMHHDYAIGWLH